MKQIRDNISFMSQNSYISDGTFRSIIASHSKIIDDSKVEWAAKISHLHDYICSLDEGYNTLIRENGSNLSGGQRQRLAIAKYLYDTSRTILIFDEATSALDRSTEEIVMKAILGLPARYTIIVISHNTSILKNCDLIYEFTDNCLIRHYLA